MSDLQPLKSLEQLKFRNSFVESLPADSERENYCRRVTEACYSFVTPESVCAPSLISYSPEVANLLELKAPPDDLGTFVSVFSGNRLLEGMAPYAACYGGHQFGNWAGQLGDGRAIALGEVLTSKGQGWELQLKGAGPTPYSRRGDGYAVIRSSVREFLCSEAMHHLGVPTTRALSLVDTGERVVRDMFYNGNPSPEPGAVVCRVAPSFLRFGNFELFASRGDLSTLKRLLDYTVTQHFSHLGEPSKEVYLSWFQEVCQRTALMIVHWMRVGFVHGVMNTDNMSVLGLTIDYGPYGWLEDFDPSWTPNTTDSGRRRYRYGNQPQIALWNLARLAEAIFPLVEDAEAFEESLDQYKVFYAQSYSEMMAQKLGLRCFEGDPLQKEVIGDSALIQDLQDAMQLVETDRTILFRKLADVCLVPECSKEELLEPLMDSFYEPGALKSKHKKAWYTWLLEYRSRVRRDGTSDEERRSQMNAVNPKYVLRNYMAQLAIDEAENGDGSLVDELLDVMRAPYDEQPNRKRWAEKRPEWARNRPGCSMLSCSS